MSCNTFIPIMDLVREVEALLAANYIDKDDPRITGGVFTNPTIKEGFLLDVQAREEFCRLVQECGLDAPFGKMWLSRPLYPDQMFVSYEDSGEPQTKWKTIQAVLESAGVFGPAATSLSSRLAAEIERSTAEDSAMDIRLEDISASMAVNSAAIEDNSAAISAESVRAAEAESVLRAKTQALSEADESLQGQIDSIGGGKYSFLTYAAMTAAADLPANSSVDVSNDPDEAKNGTYTYDGQTFTLAPFDALAVTKRYVDSNPRFKAKKIVAGDDFNVLTEPGSYVHWGTTLTKSQVANAPYYLPNNDMVFGVLEVINTVDTASSATRQTFYPYDDTNEVVSRKRKLDGVYGPWITQLDAVNRYKLVALSTGQDLLALGQGDYFTPSLAVGKSLVNAPTSPNLFGRVTVRNLIDLGTPYKEVIVTPYGRDTKSYYNRNKEDGWAGWATLSNDADLKAFMAATYADNQTLMDAFNSYDGIEAFGEDYTPEQMSGTAVYPSGYIVGFNGVSPNTGAMFNEILARVSNAGAGPTEYKVYFGGKVSSHVNGYNVPKDNVLLPDFEGVCVTFPGGDTGVAQSVVLDRIVRIPKNTPFVIAFKKVTNNRFSIGYSSTPTPGLTSNSFNLVATPVAWGEAAIGSASTANQYYEAGFKLRIKRTENAGGGETTPTYIPELVLPPKVYCLAGLQAHIYPEHITREPSDIYLHDVTCLRGMQTIRGWVYDVPTTQPAGDLALGWAIHDRQTGAILSAAESLVVVAPQTTAGTKKVMVIGDSYVNAGTITQRLLDIAVADPLKVDLVGTRGTAPNRHEGRGGWKVEDYTTAGRVYYRFSVTGVTTLPAINATAYSYAGGTFTVQEVAINGGVGTITASATGAAPVAGSSGTLVKANGSGGDANITFTDVQPMSGNPFWIGGAINFGQYLTVNGLSTPDVVFIELGVNDTFNASSDAEVEGISAIALPRLDALIASIKAKNESTKIAVVSSPTYANQDAFGINYGNNQTSWRAKRNIVIWNRELYARYRGKESTGIYVVAAGVGVDTLNNFPTTTRPINSHNEAVVTVQNNGVHPADSGYRQIGDSLFAFLKAVY